MDSKVEETDARESAMVERFGTLSLMMLNDTPLIHAWRVNFLANFFVGPIYRELDEKFDLSRPEFVILFSLAQRSGLVARDICLVTGLPKNSISRAVAQLLAKGLVERRAGFEDKRAKPLVLTTSGRDKLESVIPLFKRRQADMRSALNESEQAQFDHLLEKMIYNMPNWVGAE